LGERAAARLNDEDSSVTDIFQEVEEDVRRERFEKIWKQYGDYIIAGVATIVIAVAGFKLYERYEEQQRLKASALFNTAQQAMESGNGAAAASTFGQIAKTAPSGYAQIARLAQADALFTAGNRADATAIYREVIAKDKAYLGDVARIRLAWAMVDTAPRSETETTLGPLTAPTSAWRFMAREVLAYADYHAGATAQAMREYKSLADDAGAPAPVRGRANAMASFLAAGGTKDFGSVPKPPQAPEGLPNNPKGPNTP
jgi:hypothetical protein